jgi:hypothetical protein
VLGVQNSRVFLLIAVNNVKLFSAAIVAQCITVMDATINHYVPSVARHAMIVMKSFA